MQLALRIAVLRISWPLVAIVACSSQNDVGDQGVGEGAIAAVCSQEVKCEPDLEQKHCELASTQEYETYVSAGCETQADAWLDCRAKNELRCSELDEPWSECDTQTKALSVCFVSDCAADIAITCQEYCTQESPSMLGCDCDGTRVHYALKNFECEDFDAPVCPACALVP